MKNWTVGRRIAASFGAVILLMLVMGGVADILVSRIQYEVVQGQRDWRAGTTYSAELLQKWQENFSLTEQVVLQSDPAAIAALEARITANATSQDDLLRQYDATVFDTTDKRTFAAVMKLRSDYISAQPEVLRLSAQLKSTDARARLLGQLGPAYEKVRVALQELVDLNGHDSDASDRRVLAALATARTVGIAVFLAVLVLATVTAYLLQRAITQPLRILVESTDLLRQGDFSQRVRLARKDEFGILANGFNRMTDELTALISQVQQSGVQVSATVMEIAATAKEQQATASEIAATTTEIGATSREISATSKELLKTMNGVSTVAEDSATLAGSGQVGLARMEETMRLVMEASGSINAKLAVLNEKAGNINQVVTTITKVADQTNLLSLNAAIEAEKAGEYGRGFAVVATEIRRLADQTAVATHDIGQMVKEIQSAVSAGVMGMDKFSEEVRRGMHEVQLVGGQLSQVIQQVQALAPRIETVNEGMQAQATGAEQISQALAQLSDAAQMTVESLRQSNDAIQGLNQLSTSLRAGVSRFKLQATG